MNAAESPRASKRGARRGLPPGQTVALLLTAALVGTWLWPSAPKGRAPGGTSLLPVNEAGKGGSGRQTRMAPSEGAAGRLAAVSTAALFESEQPPPVRQAAVTRMAARLRRMAAPALQDTRQASLAVVAASVPANALAANSSSAALEPRSTTGSHDSSSSSNETVSSSSISSSGGTAASGATAAHMQATPPAQFGEQAGEEGSCQPNLVVVLTSHKTGTAQAGCITEMLEQRYVSKGASRHEAHPADLHAVARFAPERLQTQFSGAGGKDRLYCPSVKFYSTGHHLPRLEDEACPGTLPCPCVGEQEQCLSTEAGTIDIPAGNTTVAQVIREPLNVVLSAYQYHMQDPAPEEWLEQMKMENFTGWMYTGGVPYHALESLGAFAAAANDSFHAFLRRLPPERGVKLQFWMSAWELYGFARQYASLERQHSERRLRFLPIRFEDLQDNYNSTATSMLEAYKEQVPAVDVPSLLAEVQVCHVSTWNSSHLASHEHVTTNRDPGLRATLRRVLMADPEIAPRICELTALFGYDVSQLAECGEAGDGAGDSGEANSSSGGEEGGGGGSKAPDTGADIGEAN